MVKIIEFTNPVLRTPLEARQVKMTIRSPGYVKRKNLRENDIVKIVYRRGRYRRYIGHAKIVLMQKTLLGELTETDAILCGYPNLETLVKWVKIYNRFRIPETEEALTLIKIHIEWIGIPALTDFLKIEKEKK